MYDFNLDEESMFYAQYDYCLDYFSKYNTNAFNKFELLSEEVVNEMLFRATTIIDDNNFKGVKKDKNQFKQFPRILNGEVIEIPEKIKMATCEIAYSLFLLSNKNILNKTNSQVDKAKSKTLDKLRIEYFESNTQLLTSKDLVPVIANIYIKDYLAPLSSKVGFNNYKVIRS